jgi:hypothetical protein
VQVKWLLLFTPSSLSYPSVLRAGGYECGTKSPRRVHLESEPGGQSGATELAEHYLEQVMLNDVDNATPWRGHPAAAGVRPVWTEETSDAGQVGSADGDRTRKRGSWATVNHLG